ncbi:hypothetical protein HYFRA_00008405 [Hymenoscyphus fraxineus]|uniref:Uncharacterized protein n=1 Tax=Hymenoscyphus fraxineus TaxID=746836 RepID=A0A9N9PP06_9HELO|nr:hypothetical protein HYFRA_00008405 [Hymenoscyphus fraxineus]
MSPQYFYERDRRGRERLVKEDFRSRSRTFGSPHRRDDLSDAHERISALERELATCLDRLSRAEARVHEMNGNNQDIRRIHGQIQDLQIERNELLGEIDDLQRDLRKEERKYDELKDKYKMLKRDQSQHDQIADGYKLRYEQKRDEVELLRQSLRERDEEIYYHQERLAAKDRTIQKKDTFIAYLVNFLRNTGYHIVDGRIR